MVQSATPRSETCSVRVQPPSSAPFPAAMRDRDRTPRQRMCSKQAILRSAPSDTSLVLYPREPQFGQIWSGRSNNFSSNVLGLRIGGRLTSRPCMDSLAGDAIVRFRAPGSILITRDYFRPLLSSLQGLLNRGVWKRQTCHVPLSSNLPVLRRICAL